MELITFRDKGEEWQLPGCVKAVHSSWRNSNTPHRHGALPPDQNHYSSQTEPEPTLLTDRGRHLPTRTALLVQDELCLGRNVQHHNPLVNRSRWRNEGNLGHIRQDVWPVDKCIVGRIQTGTPNKRRNKNKSCSYKKNVCVWLKQSGIYDLLMQQTPERQQSWADISHNLDLKSPKPPKCLIFILFFC